MAPLAKRREVVPLLLDGERVGIAVAPVMRMDRVLLPTVLAAPSRPLEGQCAACEVDGMRVIGHHHLLD